MKKSRRYYINIVSVALIVIKSPRFKGLWGILMGLILFYYLIILPYHFIHISSLLFFRLVV